VRIDKSGGGDRRYKSIRSEKKNNTPQQKTAAPTHLPKKKRKTPKKEVKGPTPGSDSASQGPNILRRSRDKKDTPDSLFSFFGAATSATGSGREHAAPGRRFPVSRSGLYMEGGETGGDAKVVQNPT